MINQGRDVPDKTIAVFYKNENDFSFTDGMLDSVLTKPNKKRDWFTPHFYRCLPLTIGNQQGFIVTSQYEFGVEWNGGPGKDDVRIYSPLPPEESQDKFPGVESHFGSGIVTINLPFFLRTPPKVNLMTINPPNTILPNITVMTGVVETDNLRRNFTLNLKIQMPHIRITFPIGTPLAGILPIPRYYSDEFKLVSADKLFTKEEVAEELKASLDADIKRGTVEVGLKNQVGRDYYLGKDVYGNKFPDHQKP